MQTLFNGRYKIIKTIGRGSGGKSSVYLAENIALENYWAIKVIENDWDDDSSIFAEANILKKLNHPDLPRIVDIYKDKQYIYIVQDYIEGISLDKKLKIQNQFEESTIVEWGKQLCKILLYLHNQKPNPIIHRDIKPANIILTPNDTLKLIDFGIAREFKIENSSDTTYMGSKGYAAPEQYGKSQTDKRTDIYSFGVTMYRLLTGKRPSEIHYEFKKLRMINSNLSEGIEFIVNKCVQNNPENRYQRVEDLLYDLEHIHTFNSIYKKQRNIEKLKAVVKSSLIIISSSCIILGVNVMGKDKEEEYNSLINKGYSNLKIQKFDEAESYFDKAQNNDKDKIDSYLGKSQILLKQKKYEECIAYLNNIETQIDNIYENDQYLYLKGNAYYELKEYTKASKNFEKALEKNQENIDYARDLTICYAKLGELDKAHRITENFISKGSSDDVMYYVNGEILLESNELNLAIENFDKVIDMTKNEDIKKKSYIAISNIYKDNEMIIEDAISKRVKILEEAVVNLKDKDDIVITEALGDAYSNIDEYGKASEYFGKLLKVGYDRPYVYRNLAITYQYDGNLVSAEEVLLEMKDKYLDDYTCYLQLAFLYLEMEGYESEYSRDYDKVLENYNLALQFAPEGSSTVDIVPLTKKINELKQKGWV